LSEWKSPEKVIYYCFIHRVFFCQYVKMNELKKRIILTKKRNRHGKTTTSC